MGFDHQALHSFYISFTKYPILRSPEWIGLRNYVNMFTKEPNFWQAVQVTFTYALTAVPLGILGAFLLALLLNQNLKDFVMVSDFINSDPDF